jgi:hypothetical protein
MGKPAVGCAKTVPGAKAKSRNLQNNLRHTFSHWCGNHRAEHYWGGACWFTDYSNFRRPGVSKLV